MTKLIPVRELLDSNKLKTTAAPQGQGNARGVWPILINGGEIVKTNPIGMTPDAMSLRAARTLDRVGVDRSQAMRFGLSFYALLYGGWDVLPDIIYKLDQLVKDGRIGSPLKGTVAALFEKVMSLVPTNTG